MRTVFDDQYLTEVYRRHRERVLAYLTRITGDRDLAEDLYQEALFTFWERGEYVPYERVLFTLFLISKNKARNYSRVIKELALFQLDLAYFPGNDRSEEINEVINLVLAPGLLHEKSRGTFGLVRLMGKSLYQAARAINISKTSAHRRITKVDAILSKVFKELNILPEDGEYAKDVVIYKGKLNDRDN